MQLDALRTASASHVAERFCEDYARLVAHGEHRIEWHGDRVDVTAPSGRTAHARWSQGALVDRSGELDESISWEALEQSLRSEAEALIEATSRSAYDARGVDVTQIDRMLALSPRDRLAVLDAQRRALSRLRRDANRR